jgi:HK97 family phage major capsid protein
MKLTPALKKWLEDNEKVEQGAEDEAYSKALATAMMDGSLPGEKYVELAKDPDADKAGQIQDMLKQVLDGQQTLGERVALLEKPAEKEEKPKKKGGDEQPTKAPKMGEEKEPAESSYFEKVFAAGSPDPVEYDPKTTSTVRVIGAEERYDSTRRRATYPMKTLHNRPHPMGGQPVSEGGRDGQRAIDEASDRDKAVAGAYVKWCIWSQTGGRNIPRELRMTDHDRGLIQWAMEKLPWGGVLNGVGSEDSNAIALKNERLTPRHMKALIDDSTSGGIEAAPIVFDDQAILVPLLFGEVYPRVNTVNINRGRRIEGTSFGTVTLTSGGADASAIPLFNTASFISAFDTSIFVVNGAIEIGMDFVSDSPLDIGGIVTQQYGEVMLQWLDEQCCIGDGTTEPEGVFNATGTTTVNADNGAAGAPTVGDYETLLFGISKAYKRGTAANRITFIATETSYSRARGIAVGGADQRRVFGMTHEDYMLLNHPYAINEQLTNRQQGFVNWSRYRMYRRLGLTIKVTTEGKELVRNNLMLMTARARFGGQLEDGGAAAICADAQS